MLRFESWNVYKIVKWFDLPVIRASRQFFSLCLLVGSSELLFLCVIRWLSHSGHSVLHGCNWWAACYYNDIHREVKKQTSGHVIMAQLSHVLFNICVIEVCVLRNCSLGQQWFHMLVPGLMKNAFFVPLEWNPNLSCTIWDYFRYFYDTNYRCCSVFFPKCRACDRSFQSVQVEVVVDK